MGGSNSAPQPQARTPQQAPVSLQANNIANILEVISEGEIKGLVNGLNSVQFNDTPLQNNDGSFNFLGVEFQARLGTEDQTELSGFGGVETITAVSAKIEQATPIVRTINNEAADYVRIKVAVPSLQFQDINTGDIYGTGVEFKIEIDENETGYKQFGQVWERLGPTGNNYFTTGNAEGFRVVLTKAVSNPTESFMLDNVESVQVGYRALPSGDIQYAYYDVTPSSFSIDGGASQFISQNFKMEEAGASTAERYTLFYTLDDEIINLAPEQYQIIPPDGWVVSEIFQLITRNTLIWGRTTSTYEREYLVLLPKENGGAPWNIRLSRITADSDGSNLQNDLFWTSYAEGVETKLTYANRAIAGVKIDASLFGNNLPKRSYLLDGMLVKVPVTYDPIQHTYDEPLGYWDGTFKTEWTNNPVWVLYDVLTNERYGGGHFIAPAQVDKYSFYECAKYCDELVPVAGKSALEPRFTFNYWFANGESFYDIVNRIASSFNGMVYSVNDVIILTMDRPKEITAIFSQANVVNNEGVTFSYSSASADTTSSVVQVRWNDPDKNYEQAITTVEDPDLIEIYGYQLASVTAFGCTSEGQARRQGTWLLDTQKSQYQTVTFQTGLQGADIMIGDVIGVYDPSYQLLRQSGRIRAFYANIGQTGYQGIRLDAPVSFDSLQSYTIYVMLRNGSIVEREIKPVDENGVVTYGTSEYVRLEADLEDTTANADAFDLFLLTEDDDYILADNGDFLLVNTLIPSAGLSWGINASNLAPREFYVTSKAEKTGNEKFQYVITALEYDRTKYDRIERGIITAKVPTTLLGQNVILHSNLKGVGYFEKIDGLRIKRLLLSWTASPDRRITSYAVYYKEPQESTYILAGVTSNSVYDLSIVNNLLDVRIEAIQTSASESRVMGFIEAQLDFAEGNTPPANVLNFQYSLQDTDLNFSWDAVADNDLEGYELRFTPKKSGTSWELTPFFAFTTDTRLSVPYQDGTYYIKARDWYGAYSVNEASRVTFSKPDVAINIVETLTESPDFTGTKTACSVSSEGLSMSNPEVDDTAFYEFADTIVLDDVYVSRLTSVIEFVMGDVSSWVSFMPDISAEPTMATVDSDTVASIDDFASIPLLSDVGYIAYEQGMIELQVATSLDGTNFGEWQQFSAGDYEAYSFKFRLVLRSFGGTRIPTITTLSVTCDMPDRLESDSNVVLASDWNTITYAEPYKETPNLQVTAIDLESNEHVEIQNETRTGFEVRVVHGGGSLPSGRTINWLTRGYGKTL